MNGTWYYLARASGIIATVLIVAALGGGFLFSARATGKRRRPQWWLDLHNYLGGLAFAFTVVHIVTIFADRDSGIGLLQIFIPMTAGGWTWGITWGVLATYVFAAVVFTSWPGRRLSRRTWLTVHLLSVPATVMAAGHAWMVGSSRHGLWFQALVALMAGLAVYPAILRLAGVVDRRRRAAPGVRRRPTPLPEA
ncbi:MAG: ferric reductase-like transmembrane domain-containing protein [Actinobacteria bacterium]|nr:ferric reductase-like transmembrane domain-containing protein [Actinomycetota bacterium]